VRRASQGLAGPGESGGSVSGAWPELRHGAGAARWVQECRELGDDRGVEVDPFLQVALVCPQAPVLGLEVGELVLQGLEGRGQLPGLACPLLEVGYEIAVLVGEDPALHAGLDRELDDGQGAGGAGGRPAVQQPPGDPAMASRSACGSWAVTGAPLECGRVPRPGPGRGPGGCCRGRR